MVGYVYLIGTPVFKWYKIGKSRTPEVRVQDLGILLPFKIEVIGVWKAKNHTALESELHSKYNYCRINGEWFNFEHNEVHQLFQLLPASVRVYPSDNTPDSVFARFSNVEEDRRKGKKVIGVKTQKLRGNFTPEEREEKRQAAIRRQKEKKLIREISKSPIS